MAELFCIQQFSASFSRFIQPVSDMTALIHFIDFIHSFIHSFNHSNFFSSFVQPFSEWTSSSSSECFSSLQRVPKFPRCPWMDHTEATFGLCVQQNLKPAWGDYSWIDMIGSIRNSSFILREQVWDNAKINYLEKMEEISCRKSQP